MHSDLQNPSVHIILEVRILWEAETNTKITLKLISQGLKEDIFYLQITVSVYFWTEYGAQKNTTIQELAEVTSLLKPAIRSGQ